MTNAGLEEAQAGIKIVMGTTIVLASLIVIMNLLSDIMYKIVDPRITLE